MKEKLVRDLLSQKIPVSELRKADQSEIEELLKAKLIEEMEELKSSNFTDIEEYADVLEVLSTIARLKCDASLDQINDIRKKKLEEKGGFNLGLVWTPALLGKRLKIYADGACSGNPGPGGWGVVIQGEKAQTTFSGGSQQTTNNQMELTAAITAVQKATSMQCEHAIILMDSSYVLDGLNKWMQDWKKRSWRTSSGKPVKNLDLWQKLDHAVQNCTFTMEWKWVKGHSGDIGNEMADELATNQILKFK